MLNASRPWKPSRCHPAKVEATSATLNGKVNPHNSEVTYAFEYGPDESYGTAIPVPAEAIGTIDNANHAVSQVLEGLAEDTTYHFRLSATNTEADPDEVTHGEDRTFTTPTAAGPKACPNEQLRAENNSLALPDCRAYEQVSPVKKNGFDAGAPNGIAGYAHATADGNGILFKTRGPQGDVVTRGIQTLGVARRGAQGWRTVSAVPSPNTQQITVEASPISPLPSADLSKLLFVTGETFNAPDNPPSFSKSGALYLSDLDGSINWITRPQIENPVPPPGEIASGLIWNLGGSPDLSTFYFWAAPTLLPSDSARAESGSNGWGLYEYSEGQLRSAATLPPGTVPATTENPEGTAEPPGGAAPAAGPYSAHNRNISQAEDYANTVSRDGSALFFVSPDPFVAPYGEFLQTQLYVRHDGHSTLVSHAEDGSPAPDGVKRVNPLNGGEAETYFSSEFAYASADGSTAIFKSTSALTSSAPTDASIKSYSYDVKSDTVTYLPGVGNATVAAASDDGSRFLFGGVSTGIKLWANNAIRTIYKGPVSRLGPARTTPSGSAFVFSTEAPIPGFNSGNVIQVYRYDLAIEQLSCLSCPPEEIVPSGPATLVQPLRGVANEGMIPFRAISTDARRVFFDSPDQLIPADGNDARDVYEWTPGGLFLISSGQGKKDSFFLDSSADGSDVFFATAEGLDPRDSDSSYDVYDARVGGGFAQVPAVADCSANEVCKKASPPPPNRPSPATNSFSGPGSPPSCPKGKVRKHGKCVKKKPRKHKHHKKAHKKGQRTASHSRGGSK